MKASIAGIDFIISSATKHNVEPETLSDELQQLGLPKGCCFTVLFVEICLDEDFPIFLFI